VPRFEKTQDRMGADIPRSTCNQTFMSTPSPPL
jgi:hypothetical protein